MDALVACVQHCLFVQARGNGMYCSVSARLNEEVRAIRAAFRPVMSLLLLHLFKLVQAGLSGLSG